MPEPATKHAHVMNTLAEQWSREAHASGTRLPGERALARQLGVSRETVKTAMDKLEAAGVVARRGTSGTYLTKRPTSELLARFNQANPPRGRGRRSAAGPRAKVVTRKTYRLAFLHCLAPGDESAGDVTGGVSHYCNEHGHALSVGLSRPTQGVIHGFHEQVYHPDADGIVLWVTLRERDIPNLERIPVPYVVLSHEMGIDQNCVWLDSSLGCERAIGVFGRQQARHITVLEVQYPDTPPHLRGACLAMADRTPGTQIDHVFAPDPVAKFLQSGRKTDAMYFDDDFCCAKALPRLREAGMNVGSKLKVISLSRMHHENVLPPSVGQMSFDVFELGRQAVMMLERLLDEKVPSLHALRIAPRYVPPKEASSK